MLRACRLMYVAEANKSAGNFRFVEVGASSRFKQIALFIVFLERALTETLLNYQIWIAGLRRPWTLELVRAFKARNLQGWRLVLNY